MFAIGDVIVVAALLPLVILAVRSLWRGRKKSACCGDCSKCHGCEK